MNIINLIIARAAVFALNAILLVAAFDIIVRYYSRASLALIGPSFSLSVVTLKALMALSMAASLQAISMGKEAILVYRIIVQCSLVFSTISVIVLHFRCINDIDVNSDLITIMHPLGSA